MVGIGNQLKSKPIHIYSIVIHCKSDKVINIENDIQNSHHKELNYHHRILHNPKPRSLHKLEDNGYLLSHILEYYIHNKPHINIMYRVINIEIDIQNIHQTEYYSNHHTSQVLPFNHHHRSAYILM